MKDNEKNGSQKETECPEPEKVFEDARQPAVGSGKFDTENDAGRDEIDTAGGRQGQFSDKDRDNKDQWSPGSIQPTDN